MTKPTETGRRSKKYFIMAGVAAIAIALAGVYVIVGPNGNITGPQSCDIEMAAAKAAKPFATGEVAAFRPAEKPLELSDLKFSGPDGKPVAMTEFKDRTILFNVWATWCAPCRKEMPALDQLQADMGNDNFKVVAVNLDRGSDEKPKAFLKEIGVSHLDFYSDPSNKLLIALRGKARATGLPTTMLVGPSGCEVGTMYGPAEWASDEAKSLISAIVSATSAGTEAN